MVAILEFKSEQFYLFLLYKTPWCFLPSFKSIGLSVQEKTWKIDFKDSSNGGHLGFPNRMILAIFDLRVTLMLPTKIQINWPFGSGEGVKNRFSRWWPRRPSGISDRDNFSYFWCTSHQNASYQNSSQLAFGSGEEAKNRFSRWRPSLISNLNNFIYFWSTSPPDASYQVSSQLAFQFRRWSEKQIFKMVTMAAILDFLSELF